jgi:hypothetical protein
LVTGGQQNIVYYLDCGIVDYGMCGVILKLNTSESKEWVRFYKHPEVVQDWTTDYNLYDIKPTSDGGFVSAGWFAHSIDNTQDTWVIKVDSFGCLVPGCELTSVPKIERSITALNIYPNPANEVVHFDITPNGNQQSYELTLYDM